MSKGTYYCKFCYLEDVKTKSPVDLPSIKCPRCDHKMMFIPEGQALPAKPKESQPGESSATIYFSPTTHDNFNS